MKFFSVVLNQWVGITIASTVLCPSLSLYQQWNSSPSSSLLPIQISPVVFWKGGYIHSCCMILLKLSSFEEWGRADQSWVIPAVSPSLGKTWVSPTTRILLSFIPICILPAPSCNWNNFMSAQQLFRAHLRCTQGCSPPHVDPGVFVLVEAFENKQEDT